MAALLRFPHSRDGYAIERPKGMKRYSNFSSCVFGEDNTIILDTPLRY